MPLAETRDRSIRSIAALLSGVLLCSLTAAAQGAVKVGIIIPSSAAGELSGSVVSEPDAIANLPGIVVTTADLPDQKQNDKQNTRPQVAEDKSPAGVPPADLFISIGNGDRQPADQPFFIDTALTATSVPYHLYLGKDSTTPIADGNIPLHQDANVSDDDGLPLPADEQLLIRRQRSLRLKARQAEDAAGQAKQNNDPKAAELQKAAELARAAADAEAAAHPEAAAKAAEDEAKTHRKQAKDYRAAADAERARADTFKPDQNGNGAIPSLVKDHTDNAEALDKKAEEEEKQAAALDEEAKSTREKAKKQAPTNFAPDPVVFSTPPIYTAGTIEVMEGTIPADDRQTHINVDGKACRLISAKRGRVFFEVPADITPGKHDVNYADRDFRVTIEVVFLKLTLRADRLNLRKGESTDVYLTLSGPEQLSAENWAQPGRPAAALTEPTKLATDAGLSQMAPADKGETVLFIQNASPDVVRSSKLPQNSTVLHLHREDFPYSFTDRLRSTRDGGFNYYAAAFAFIGPARGIAQPVEKSGLNPQPAGNRIQGK